MSKLVSQSVEDRLDQWVTLMRTPAQKDAYPMAVWLGVYDGSNRMGGPGLLEDSVITLPSYALARITYGVEGIEQQIIVDLLQPTIKLPACQSVQVDVYISSARFTTNKNRRVFGAVVVDDVPPLEPARVSMGFTKQVGVSEPQYTWALDPAMLPPQRLVALQSQLVGPDIASDGCSMDVILTGDGGIQTVDDAGAYKPAATLVGPVGMPTGVTIHLGTAASPVYGTVVCYLEV